MMFPRKNHDRSDTEAGASIIEASALIVVAAVLLGGFAVMVRSKLEPGVDQAVCTLFSVGGHCRTSTGSSSPGPLAMSEAPDPGSGPLLNPHRQGPPVFQHKPVVSLKTTADKSKDAEKNRKAVEQLAVDCAITDLGGDGKMKIPDNTGKHAKRPDKCFFCPGDPTPGIHERMNTCDDFTRKPDTYVRYITKEHYPNNKEFEGHSPGLAFNCSSVNQQVNYQAQDTQGTTNSIDTTFTVGAELDKVLWKLFKAKMDVAVGYSHTWVKSHTYSVRAANTIAPGKVGWVALTETRQKVRGVWVMNFGSTYSPVGDNDDKHYQWMITNATVDSPDVNGATKTVFRDRDMTPQEKSEFCGSSHTLVKKSFGALPNG